MKQATIGQIGALNIALSGMFMSIMTGKNSDLLSQIDGERLKNILQVENNRKLALYLIGSINDGLYHHMTHLEHFLVDTLLPEYAAAKYIKLGFSDQFREEILVPNRGKTLPVRLDAGELALFYLPQAYNSDQIQVQSGNPGGMSLDVFLSTFYLLIFEKEMAKNCFGNTLSKHTTNIFHVEMGDGSLRTVCVYLEHDTWICHLFKFVSFMGRPGNHFLYFH